MLKLYISFRDARYRFFKPTIVLHFCILKLSSQPVVYEGKNKAKVDDLLFIAPIRFVVLNSQTFSLLYKHALQVAGSTPEPQSPTV